jgi:hypothetical protein
MTDEVRTSEILLVGAGDGIGSESEVTMRRGALSHPETECRDPMVGIGSDQILGTDRSLVEGGVVPGAGSGG